MTQDRKTWEKYWASKNAKGTSDHELDRGTASSNPEMERFSDEELLHFLSIERENWVFDAGCGTGRYISLLGKQASLIVGMDYSHLMIERCKERAKREGLSNCQILTGSVSAIGVSSDLFDRLICMSVFQYLDDEESDRALNELVRIGKNGAIIVFHVKNLCSIYLSTLYMAKKMKRMLSGNVKIENYRTLNWYKKQLSKHGIVVMDYNSVNKLNVDHMPAVINDRLQGLELFLYKRRIFRGFGSELKIKGRIVKN